MNNILNYNPRSEWERWTGSNKCPYCSAPTTINITY